MRKLYSDFNYENCPGIAVDAAREAYEDLMNPKFRRYELNGCVICASEECSESAWELWVAGVRIEGTNEDPAKLVDRLFRIAGETK